MMRFVKGKGRGDGESDRRSISSFGSKSSVAMSASNFNLSSVSPSMSLSKAPVRLLQSSWSLSQEDESVVDPTSTKLHQAAGRGAEEKVVKHLKKTDVNSVDGKGRTPLHLSCAAGQLRVTRRLVEAGAELDVQDRRGVTALGRAVEAGHLDTVHFMQERGAQLDVPDEKGETCVHLAVRARQEDILAVLVRRGANPDIINYEGESPLHLAVSASDVTSTNILLRAGALVNIRSHRLVTPLMLAAKSGKEELVATLLEFDARVEEADQDGNTAFVYAKNNREIIEMLERYDRSKDQVTHFPSKAEPIPELEAPSPANLDGERNFQEEQEEQEEDDSWNDSLPLSDDDFKSDNRLVKSKVGEQFSIPSINTKVPGNVRPVQVHDRPRV